MHSEFVNIADGSSPAAQGSGGVKKMAKSEENFITLQTLKERGIHPLAYRLWLLGAHYRTPLNFSLEALKNTQNELQKIHEIVYRLDVPGIGIVNQTYKKELEEFIYNDLDTPNAKALLWEIIKDKNLTTTDKRATVFLIANVLGINFTKLADELPNPVFFDYEIFGKEIGGAQKSYLIPQKMRNLIVLREEARAEKDFEKADRLRQEINIAGYDIEDTAHGVTLKKRS